MARKFSSDHPAPLPWGETESNPFSPKTERWKTIDRKKARPEIQVGDPPPEHHAAAVRKWLIDTRSTAAAAIPIKFADPTRVDFSINRETDSEGETE